MGVRKRHRKRKGQETLDPGVDVVMRVTDMMGHALWDFRVLAYLLGVPRTLKIF